MPRRSPGGVGIALIVALLLGACQDGPAQVSTERPLAPATAAPPVNPTATTAPDATSVPDPIADAAAEAEEAAEAFTPTPEPERLQGPREYRTVPNDLPIPEVTLVEPGVDDGYLFMSVFPRRLGQGQGEVQYMMIVDNDGELVYYRELARSHDFKVLDDGRAVYRSGGRHDLIDSSYEVDQQVVGVDGVVTDFHDIELLRNGNFATLTYEKRIRDLSAIAEEGSVEAAVLGCRIDEQDVDGNVAFSWTSHDHLPVQDSKLNLRGETVDYVHCNSIEEDLDGNFIISSRELDEITKINRATGEVMWRWGGKANQFEFVNAIGAENVDFVAQHDVRRAPNGNVTVFDNRNGASQYSRVSEYELDEENLIATLVWEYRNDPDSRGALSGSMQRLASGNSVIGWGSAEGAAVTEVTRDGTKVFELSLPIEMTNYRAYRHDWTGRPTEDPVVIIEDGDSAALDTISVIYSWNGATDVAAYRVYGDIDGTPTLLAIEPSTGFETTTTFNNASCLFGPSAPTNIQVVPVDGEGSPMLRNVADGRSDATPLLETADC